jgi:hypothetical protein
MTRKLDPRIYCTHCEKPLTPGEMVEMGCESCCRSTVETSDEQKEAA